jgi:SAD/SRA domain
MSSINKQNSATDGFFMTMTGFKTIISWNEVSEIHKVRHGIYQRNGQLISLLTDFGKLTPCYQDFHGDKPDEILYTGSGRRGDQKLDAANRALINAIETKTEVPLFCKLKVGQWEFLGLHQVTKAEYIFDEITKRMVWKFTLKQLTG